MDDRVYIASSTDTFIKTIAANLRAPRTVYAGTSGAGLFKSSDDGRGWIRLDDGLTHPYIQALAIGRLSPTAAMLNAGSVGGVFALPQTSRR